MMMTVKAKKKEVTKLCTTSGVITPDGFDTNGIDDEAEVQVPVTQVCDHEMGSKARVYNTWFQRIADHRKDDRGGWHKAAAEAMNEARQDVADVRAEELSTEPGTQTGQKVGCDDGLDIHTNFPGGLDWDSVADMFAA